MYKRARFNPVLDGNVGVLIFKYLSNLDKCMARAVCVDWSRLIQPQRLTFHNDFEGTLADYDGCDYVSQVELHTTFRENLGYVWSQKSTSYICVKHASYTYMFYTRIVYDTQTTFLMFVLLCLTQTQWDTILLPILTFDAKKSNLVFCQCICDNKTDLLDWLFKKRLVYLKDDVLNMVHALDFLEEKALNSLRYLKQTNRLKDHHWEEMVERVYDYVCFYSIRNLPDFVKLVEIYGKVPSSVCRLHPQHHLAFRHVCGCDVGEKNNKRQKN